MSASKKFITTKLSPLQRIKRLISETIGMMPDYDYLKCKHNRMNMSQNHPGSFLGKTADGVPIFPIRNQFGGMSYTILKNSIRAAQSQLTRTGDVKYMEIIRKLEEELRAVESKVGKSPETYHPTNNLMTTLTRFQGDNNG